MAKNKRQLKRKLFKNKRAIGTAYVWIYGLVSLFALGVLYVVFNQVFMQYIIPTIKNQANSTYAMPGTEIDQGTVQQIYNNIDRYMSYFHALPYVIFLVVVIYMIIMGIRRERTDEYV